MEEEIFGTLGNDTLTGTAGNDRITPFSGDDVIDGRAGTDTLVFFGTHADYIITQNADGSWTLSDTEEAVDNQGSNRFINIENIEFTRTGTFTPAELLALQTTNNQTLMGTDGPEDLSGSLGDDTLIAGAGSDSLYGGPGDDRLASGAGDDFVNGGTGQDVLVLEGAFDDFTISDNGDTSFTIRDIRAGAGNQGTDIVVNVEQIEFSNGQSLSITDWLNGVIPAPLVTTFLDVAGENQFITGGQGTDAFVISGSSTDYGWGATNDGQGIVVWQLQGANFDILNNVEQVRFDNGMVERQADGSFDFTPSEPVGPGVNIINDDATQNENVAGTVGTDAFVIDGNSTDYGWGATNDGLGTVVWQGAGFDILNDIEIIAFNDGLVRRQGDGTYQFTLGDSVDQGETNVPDGGQTITGTDGNDDLRGGGGDDIITAGDGFDVLSGLVGDDTLTGGALGDTFIFVQDNGNDTITDFEAGSDLLDFSDVANVLGDLTIAQNGGDTVISFADGSVTLQGFNGNFIAGDVVIDGDIVI